MTTTVTTSTRLIGAMRLVAAAIAVIGGVKVVAIVAELGGRWEDAPWGFLVVFCLPFVLAAALLGRAPRSGVALLAVCTAELLAFIGVGVAGSEEFPHLGWGDWLLVAGGGAGSVLALVLALVLGAPALSRYPAVRRSRCPASRTPDGRGCSRPTRLPASRRGSGSASARRTTPPPIKRSCHLF